MLTGQLKADAGVVLFRASGSVGSPYAVGGAG
jgi:hypothetical protein